MKKVIVLILVTALLLLPLPAYAAQSGEVSLTAHLYNDKDSTAVRCRFYDAENQIPYIHVLDFLTCIYKGEFTLRRIGKSMWQVRNPQDKTMRIDVEKDAVRFDEYEKFLEGDLRGIEETKPEGKYIHGDTNAYVKSVRGADFDCGGCGIDLKAEDGAVYLPLATLGDLFAPTYHAAQYIGGAVYFTDVMQPEYFESRSLIAQPTREKALRDFTYSELCFVMDNLYGFPPKSRMARELADKDFDTWLGGLEGDYAGLKDLLQAERLTDFFCGLAMLDSLADDGGHTGFCIGYLNLALHCIDMDFSAQVREMLNDPKNAKERCASAYVRRLNEKYQERTARKDARRAAFDSLVLVRSWEDEDTPDTTAAALYQTDGGVIFSFDEFKDTVTEPFLWSLRYAREEGYKDFVVDVSCNSGGSSAAALYLLALMTGQGYLPESCAHTGNFLHETGQIDKNLDGQIDAEDDLQFDFQYGVLASRSSFSCANSFAALAKDNGIPVLGETTAGGTCMLMVLSLPCAPIYSISGVYVLTDNSGSDVDAGAEADFVLTEGGDEGLFDTESLFADIDAFYKEKTAEASAAEVPAPAASTETIPRWVFCAAAGGLLLVSGGWITAIVLIKKKSKPPVP